VLTPAALALLCAASVATGALSAVLGMAGGITLLALMLLWMDPMVAIPIHGVVQLVSNGSRTLAQREHVHWSFLACFGAPLLPAAFAGLALSRAVPRGATEIAIGAFVLIATWRPGWLRFGADRRGRLGGDPRRRMLAAGGVVGFFSTTVGATGPLAAPFFLRLGLDRRGLIGTQAACQMLQHLAKIAVFGAVGFAFRDWLLPLLALSTTAVAGTWLGTRLLDRVSEDDFRALYMGVLTVLALRLIEGEALALWGR
jgi:uncharacterized membrane protein YfcA